MKGKYYYFLLTKANSTDITIGATEFDDYKWLNYDEAIKLIKDTSTGGKLRITSQILSKIKDKGLLEYKNYQDVNQNESQQSDRYQSRSASYQSGSNQPLRSNQSSDRNGNRQRQPYQSNSNFNRNRNDSRSGGRVNDSRNNSRDNSGRSNYFPLVQQIREPKEPVILPEPMTKNPLSLTITKTPEGVSIHSRTDRPNDSVSISSPVYPKPNSGTGPNLIRPLRQLRFFQPIMLKLKINQQNHQTDFVFCSSD